VIHKKQIYAEEDVGGESFDNVKFVNCRFCGINLRFTSFSKCAFDNCDLSGSAFESVNFSNCKFIESKLSFIDFAEIALKGCSFEKCVMENCIFQQFKNSSKNERKKLNFRNFSFNEVNLTGSVFAFCDLDEASFERSNLVAVVFERCSLKNTNFSGSDIEGAVFETCLIKGAKLDIDGFLKFGASHGFVLEN